MPSRLLIFVTFLFWVGSMCWLVAREIAPRWRTGAPPAIVFDLTDEVGANTIDWSAHHQDREVGFGFTRIRRLPDRSFELHSEFKFQDFTLFGVVELKKLGTTYRVTQDGELLGLEIQANLTVLSITLELKVKGAVADDLLTYQGFLNDQEIPLGSLRPVPLDRDRRILNPMHLVNKVVGLYPGRTWSIPLSDPSEAIEEAALKALVQPGQRIKELIAEVKIENLTWQKENVPCFRIDYAPPGQKTLATTWVRQRDGLVLQQEADLLSQKIKLRREPRK